MINSMEYNFIIFDQLRIITTTNFINIFYACDCSLVVVIVSN